MGGPKPGAWSEMNARDFGPRLLNFFDTLSISVI